MSAPILIISPVPDVSGLPKSVQKTGVDVHHLFTDSLGIKEVRQLIEDSLRKPLELESQHFVIGAKTLTVEAQNALLKLLEEPPTTAIFYLMIPHESLLIPTLRSRFVSIFAVTGENEDDLAKSFLDLSYAKRINFVQEKVKAKEYDQLEKLVSELGAHTSSFSRDAKQSLLLAEGYLRNRGASKKMLLEELALSL